MLGTQLVTTVSGSTTLHVYHGQSIQDAINSAQPGDTIFVHNGTYYEHVTIDKSILLIGEDKCNTIIDGGGTGNIIEVTASNVNITGFTIQKSGSYPNCGIYVGEWNSGNNISHNIITNNYFGVRLYGSSGNTVSGDTPIFIFPDPPENIVGTPVCTEAPKFNRTKKTTKSMSPVVKVTE